MKISVFGLGYVGCVSIGCLAKNGHFVTGVDVNEEKVNFINKGKATIVEDQIDKIIYEKHKMGHISATSDFMKAVKESETSLICVGTPSTNQGHLKLDSVFKVAEEIGKALRKKSAFHVIAIRSTVLPGTCLKVTEIIEEISGKKRNDEFVVVSNPEFLREGSAVNDYYNPPFTLLGARNTKAINIMKLVYAEVNAPFIVCDEKVAEILKYVNNSFHALKISFANEIGNICKSLGIDSHQLMDIFCQDKILNISSYYLKPGFAYGGSCLPKDLKALKIIAHDSYLECPVIENIEKSNEIQKKIVLSRIIDFNKKNICFLGLSFKAGTDDLRNSPIVDVIEQLIGKGYEVTIYDKNVHLAKLTGANKEYIMKKIPYISNLISDDYEKLIQNSGLIVIVNKENEFKKIINNVPEDKIIYDLVRLDYKYYDNKINYFGLNW